MIRTLYKAHKGSRLIELQRVASNPYKSGHYRIAVLEYRSYKVGTITTNHLVEVDSYDYESRLKDSKRYFNWLTGCNI